MQQLSVWQITQSSTSQEALEEELCSLLNRLETLFWQERNDIKAPGQ